MGFVGGYKKSSESYSSAWDAPVNTDAGGKGTIYLEEGPQLLGEQGVTHHDQAVIRSCTMWRRDWSHLAGDRTEGLLWRQGP